MIKVVEMRKRSVAELLFAEQLRQAGIAFISEYRFHPTRRWRFDFAWINREQIAVEVEGVRWVGKGRHQTAKGYERDCEKYNTATAAGWRVFRFTQAQINDGSALEFMKRVL